MTIRRRWALVLLLLPPAAQVPAPAAAPREDTVLLLHTNDLHGHIENAATLAAFAKADRAKRADVLWLDAGDVVTGTPVSTIFKGAPIYSITSLMGVDAGCLGNHEFDHGWERIGAFREAAGYPLLCANARSPDGTLLADAEWQVFPVDGVRVGVIGLLTEKTPGMTVKKGNEGVRFEPAKEALRRLLPTVREKCNLLVALTHLGFEDDVDLARTVPGVDVIVGGHSHTALPGPVQVGDAILVQASCYGRFLGRLEVTVNLDRKRVTHWEGKPVVIDPQTQPGDPAVAAAVAALEKRVEKTVDVVVGTAARNLGREDLRALAERALRETLGTDLAFHNDSGVRGTIPKGPVSVRQIWTAFPFDNTLFTVKVPGAKLPAEMAKGTDPERVYTVATNAFVADHLDKYLPGALPGAEDSGVLMRDALVDWVKAHPDLR